MVKTIQINDARPLTEFQISQYRAAKEKISMATEPRPPLRDELTEGTFLKTKSMLESLIRGKPGREGLFEDTQRDRQLVDGIGYEALQEYLSATNNFLTELENADKLRVSIKCQQELAIVEKYEFRYNKYHN